MEDVVSIAEEHDVDKTNDCIAQVLCTIAYQPANATVRD
jgi:hypothetical protein